MKKLIYLFLFILFSVYTTLFFNYQNNPLIRIYPIFLKLLVNNKIDFQFPENFTHDLILSITGILILFFIGKWVSDKFLFYKNDKKKIPRSIYFPVGIGLIYYLFLLPTIFFFLTRIVIFIIVAFFAIFLSVWKKSDKNQTIKSDDEIRDDNKPLFISALILLVWIIFLSFYHALFYPETYWDSLIYYLHYGKLTYQQNGFPILYCAQVGLALGANYPHLYHLICAFFSVLFGYYTDFYGQLLSPMAGLIATLLIYQTGKMLFENRNLAILMALLFRSIPYTNIYFTYATDYSLVLLYTCALFYSSTHYLKYGEKRDLYFSAFFTALLPNINYLGWIFLPIFLLILYFGWRYETGERKISFIRYSLYPVLLVLGLGIPWYIRNWMVTGNPVYAFFPEIFGGKHINPEVLKSCFTEWTANGIGVPGITVIERIKNAPNWFFHIWQLNPVLFALTIPGMIYFLLFCSRYDEDEYKVQIGWVSFTLFVLGIFYHLFISNLYLYQIIFILPAMAVLATFAFADHFLFLKWFKYTVVVLIFLVALVPGLSMSIMGPKDPRPILIAFRYPGLSRERFYRIRFPEESRVWEYINRNLHQTVILSHENRYHVFKEDLTLRHPDDWDIQPLYNEPDILKKARGLYDRGIRYYLFIPNERNHPIVARLEIPKMIEQGYLKLSYQSGEYRLYQFHLP